MRYLTLNEVLDLYRQAMEQSGGAVGIPGFERTGISRSATTYDLRR